MFTASSPAEKDFASGFHFVNGDCGWVIAISSDHRYVEVEHDNGQRKQVVPYIWRNSIYSIETDTVTGEPYLDQEDIGWFIQFPLKLAYAMTIHKSQGLTLPKVHVELGSGMFAPNQLYTAVTRTPSWRCLSVDRHLKYNDLLQDPEAIRVGEETEQSAAATYDKMTRGVMWSC